MPKGYGNTVKFSDNIRENLPYILPIGYKVPMWKILSKFVGQDMTKISMPVILNEPLDTMQKSCEMLVNYSLIEKMLEPNLAEPSQDTPFASC